MKKPLPPITWFRAFDATARHLSFTLAAQELGFTQSAISQNVRALEDKLGTPLFIRGPRRLSLTEAGRLLVPDVAAAMAQLEDATARFLPVSDRERLSVAVSTSIAQWVIAPGLVCFRAQYPDLQLQISTTIWPDDFVATNADIEIRFGRKEVVGRDAILLEPSFLHAVAAPSIRAEITAETLSQQTLIQPIGLSAGWHTVAKHLGAATSFEPDILVDTHGMAVDLAVNGVGIALTHSRITRAALAEGRLVELALPHLAAEEGYYLARKSDQSSTAQDAFTAWMRDG